MHFDQLAPGTRARTLRRSMSPPERRLWSVLRNRQLGARFRRQHPVGPYVLDFFCPAERLAIEVDGQSHDFTGRQDEVRDAWLAGQGIRTLRVPARDVRDNLEGVLSLIGSALRAPSPLGHPGLGPG